MQQWRIVRVSTFYGEHHVIKPLHNYDNTVHGGQELLQAVVDAKVFNIVINSSVTVYGDPAEMPISEQCPVGDQRICMVLQWLWVKIFCEIQRCQIRAVG